MALFKNRAENRVSEYQKWDYITLSDFQLRSCGAVLSYGWLWFLAIISVAVYGADTFTAVNLLVFNRWSSEIDPTIPFRISKWIFAACILFSWVLCAYEWIRAIRVIRRRNVAESYLDPLAVTLQSIRMDKEGRGWRRFLVFAELTKSKAGADYVALFVYFQFKGAVRILLAEGPRQVVNGLTLYSVMQANLIPVGQNAANDGHSSFVQFFVNVQILANEHTEQAVILFSMLFTFIIWVVSALSLLTACALYGGFLWHYIPSTDRTLSRYCRRKIDKRLGRIVNSKFRDAIRKQDALRRPKDVDEEQMFQAPTRKPTLPAVLDKSPRLLDSDKPMTLVTVEPMPPPYSYRPTRQERLAARQPGVVTEGYNFGRPGFPTRTDTQSTKFSASSSDSEDWLLSQAATMGTSVTVRDRNEFDTYELDTKVYEGYDRRHETCKTTMEPYNTARPPRDTSHPPISNVNIIRKPIRSDSAPNAHSTPYYTQEPILAPPARAMTTSHHETFNRPAQSNNVKFGRTTHIPPPTRNFSLPNRNVSPSVLPRPVPQSQQPVDGPAYEMRAPPPSAYRGYPPPQQERQYFREGITTEVRAPLPPQPRRNMTMPLPFSSSQEVEGFPPPRRVGTEPLPNLPLHVRGQGMGDRAGMGVDRGQVPAIRGMVPQAQVQAQAQRREVEVEGTGYAIRTKKIYRFT